MKRSLYFIACLPFISFLVMIFQNEIDEGNFHVNSIQYTQPDASGEWKCTDCHEILIGNDFIHSPAAEACENCHHIDTVQHPEKIAAGLFLAEEGPWLCFICHDKVINTNGRKIANIKDQLTKGKVIHPILEDAGCVVCHEPHASSFNYLLVKSYPIGEYVPAKRENFELCWECHDSDLLEVPKTATSTNFRDGDNNLHFVHMNGEKARNCNMCHNVHASVREHLIADKIPFGSWELPINYSATETGGSCFPGCHGKKDYAR